MARGQKTEKAAAAVVEATRFTTDELLASYHVFGVPRELLAGALHGVKDATREEVEQLLKDFKTREVDR